MLYGSLAHVVHTHTHPDTTRSSVPVDLERRREREARVIVRGVAVTAVNTAAAGDERGRRKGKIQAANCACKWLAFCKE